MKTQKERIINYLRDHAEGITVIDATTKLHIMCLHKRIGELIDDGFCIDKFSVRRVREDGKIIRYTRYMLDERMLKI